METFTKLRHDVSKLNQPDKTQLQRAAAIAAAIEQELNFHRARTTLEDIYCGKNSAPIAVQFKADLSAAESDLCRRLVACVEFGAIFQQTFSSAVHVHEASETHFFLIFPATGASPESDRFEKFTRGADLFSGLGLRVRFRVVWFTEGDQYHCLKLFFNTRTLEITPHAEEDDSWPVAAAKARAWQLDEADEAAVDKLFNQFDVPVIDFREDDESIGPPIFPICTIVPHGLQELINLCEQNGLLSHDFGQSVIEKAPRTASKIPGLLEFLCLAGVASNRDCLPEVRQLLDLLIRSGETSTPAVVVDERRFHSLGVESYDRHCADFPHGANPSDIIAELQSCRPAVAIPVVATGALRDDLSALPAEILTLIIRHIFPIQSACYLRRVSKRFLHLLTDEFVTKEIQRESFSLLEEMSSSSLNPTQAFLGALAVVEAHYPNLTLDYALQLLLAEAQAVENRIKCHTAICLDKERMETLFGVHYLDPAFLNLRIEYLDTSLQQLTDNAAYDMRLQNLFAIKLPAIQNGPPEEVLFVRLKFHCRGYRGHEKFDIKVEYSLNNVAGLLLRDTEVIAEGLDFVFRQNEPRNAGAASWWAQTKENFEFLELRSRACRWALMGDLDRKPNPGSDSDEDEEQEPDYLEPDYEEKMLEFQSLKEIDSYASAASNKILPMWACPQQPGSSQSVRLLVERRTGVYKDGQSHLTTIFQSHGIDLTVDPDHIVRRGIRAPGGFPGPLRGVAAALCLLGLAPDPSFVCYLD